MILEQEGRWFLVLVLSSSASFLPMQYPLLRSKKAFRVATGAWQPLKYDLTNEQVPLWNCDEWQNWFEFARRESDYRLLIPQLPFSNSVVVSDAYFSVFLAPLLSAYSHVFRICTEYPILSSSGRFLNDVRIWGSKRVTLESNVRGVKGDFVEKSRGI